MLAGAPILQFGTGRFLQAHVDLFVSQALPLGQALGGIAVVQNTDSAQSSTRLSALSAAQGYPVRLRGLRDGAAIDEVVQVTSVRAAWHAGRDWARLLEAMASQVQVIVSNTADQGYALDSADGAQALAMTGAPPRSVSPLRPTSSHGHRVIGASGTCRQRCHSSTASLAG